MRLLNEEEIFFSTYLELIERQKKGTKYDILMTSGLLRKLLLDNLLNLANKKHKLKILFEIEDFSNFKNEIIESKKKNENFLRYRRIGPSQDKKKVNLQTFLKAPFYYVDGETLYIKELIKTYANKAGGIHVDNPNTKIEKLITNPNFHFFETPYTEVVLRDITEVTIKALVPLATTIQILGKLR
tara:strand:+ start:2366 stop:2920 length:555 start_codon:yes stop_codon:yes gene_type:complete